MGCCACRAGAHPTVWCWLFVPQSSLLRSQGATSSCQTFAGQHKGMEAKLLPSCLWSGRILVLLECRSGRRKRAACKPQPQQDGGKRTGDPWVAGGGTGRETTQQQRRRGLEEEGSEGLLETHQQLRLPSHQAHSLAPAALRSCPRWAPAARGAAPPARGHPAATLGPRVMGYLGVGLLSLPLQEPELLLLLSEEVP